jgi:hypothetical protein
MRLIGAYSYVTDVTKQSKYAATRRGADVDCVLPDMMKSELQCGYKQFTTFQTCIQNKVHEILKNTV